MTLRREKDFEEFIALLNAHKVDYLVVGGYAVAFHGKPRSTKDLDIWIHPTDANAERLMIVLNEFGFGQTGLSKADLLKPDNIVQLGYAPVRIDLIITVPGVEFDAAWLNRVTGQYGEQKVFFIGLDDLILSKKTTARHQDLADAELLEAVKDKSE